MIKQNIRKRILAFLIAFVFIGIQIGMQGFVFANADEGASLKDILTIETGSEETIVDEMETYYFKAAAETSPKVEFTAGGADYWESDDSSVASVDQNGIVTAVAPGTAKITAKSGGAGGSAVATADVYVPVISEDFEGMTAANPPTDKWGIATDGNGTPTANQYVNTSGTYFGVVSMPDVPSTTTQAFEFATAGSQGSRGRGLQKNFTAVKEDRVELDFDWNIGTLDANLTWLSIKDSEFENAASNNKGFRYLSLAAEYAASGITVSYSVNGGRDANVADSTGNNFLAPENRQTLFTNAAVNTWYNVHVALDFTKNEIIFILTEKGSTSNTTGLITRPFPADLVTAGNLDFGSISLLARGANSTQASDYSKATVKMYVDNFNVYGYDYAPYDLTVTGALLDNGTGSGSYKPGDKVSVTIEGPKDGQAFRRWKTNPDGIVMTKDAADPLKWTFTMPISDVDLTAIYDAEYEIVIGGQTNGRDIDLLGGTYNEKEKTFTFYTYELGCFSVVETQNLVTVELKIGSHDYFVKKQNKKSDVAPLIIEDKTIVPLRIIAEAFGAKVDWDESTRTVIIAIDGKTISLTIDVLSPGMDVAPIIIEGRTMVQLSYIAEAFDSIVLWDGEIDQVTIYR